MLRVALLITVVVGLLAIVPVRDRLRSHGAAASFGAQVVAVLDGDTVIVRMPEGGEERNTVVRSWGVDSGVIPQASMNSSVSEMRSASARYFSTDDEPAMNPRFHRCTLCRSAYPPWAKARNRLSVEAACA